MGAISRNLLGAHLPHALVISGLRRVGESTLPAQLAHRMGESQFYDVNFEDDRFLGFRVNDANDLYQTLLELFGECKISNRSFDYYEQVGDVPEKGHAFNDLGCDCVLLGSFGPALIRFQASDGFHMVADDSNAALTIAQRQPIA